MGPNPSSQQLLLILHRQLSLGHFSRDNQKSLTGPKTALPIYEARMTGDTRIVVCKGLLAIQSTLLIVFLSIRYTAYPILNTNAKVPPFSPFSPQLMRFPTSAAIRIFGIFTHAQICHGGFWDTLSRQLQQQGPEYIKRCTFRSEPLSAGNNVISPVTFPSLPYLVEDLPPAAPLVKVSEEDMKDVSEIDIVSKTVAKYMCTDPFHACVPPSRHHRSSHNSYIV